MIKQLTREQLMKLMKQRQGTRSQREFARELGISAQFLHDLYEGNREPGDKVLNVLGFEKRVRYIPKSAEPEKQAS